MSAFVRVARIDETLARSAPAHSWLSASEQGRLLRLQAASRRDQYLAGHWLLRCVLADHFGGKAVNYTLHERLNEPPALLDREPVLHLSLSHSSDWIACAVSSQPIGVDIEQRLPARDALLGFSHLLIAEDEVASALGVDELLQRWVAKEAWIKRDHGSALPDQLAAVKLRRAQANDDNVLLIGTDLFHLGIATHLPAEIQLPAGTSAIASSAWHARR